VLPLEIGHYYFDTKNNNLEYYVLQIENFAVVSTILMVIQFTTVVLIMTQRYKHINKWFEFHSDLWKVGRNWNHILLADMKSCVLSNHTTKYGRHQILEQRQIYSKLHDAVRIVNSYFGVPVLTFTFWMFMSVVHLSYLCVWKMATAVKDKQQPAEYNLIIVALIWSVLCVLILLIIGLSSNTGAVQMT
jgi:hypothetical protein